MNAGPVHMSADQLHVLLGLLVVVIVLVITELWALRETAPRLSDDEVHADAARQMTEILTRIEPRPVETDIRRIEWRIGSQRDLERAAAASEQGKEPLP